MIWNIFDPNADTAESVRNLPHRDQTGALTFVTFRLDDSMPADVVAKWHDEVEQWLVQHGLGGRSVDEIIASTTIEAKIKSELRKFQQRQWHGHLDDCHGECWLRQAELAKDVGDSIFHFHEQRYDVERFVVMPNWTAPTKATKQSSCCFVKLRWT